MVTLGTASPEAGAEMVGRLTNFNLRSIVALKDELRHASTLRHVDGKCKVVVVVNVVVVRLVDWKLLMVGNKSDDDGKVAVVWRIWRGSFIERRYLWFADKAEHQPIFL
jgi:hypothetical protein